LSNTAFQNERVNGLNPWHNLIFFLINSLKKKQFVMNILIEKNYELSNQITPALILILFIIANK